MSIQQARTNRFFIKLSFPYPNIRVLYSIYSMKFKLSSNECRKSRKSTALHRETLISQNQMCAKLRTLPIGRISRSSILPYISISSATLLYYTKNHPKVEAKVHSLVRWESKKNEVLNYCNQPNLSHCTRT